MVVGINVTEALKSTQEEGRQGGREAGETPKANGLITAKACNQHLRPAPTPGVCASEGPGDHTGGAWRPHCTHSTHCRGRRELSLSVLFFFFFVILVKNPCGVPAVLWEGGQLEAGCPSQDQAGPSLGLMLPRDVPTLPPDRTSPSAPPFFKYIYICVCV